MTVKDVLDMIGSGMPLCISETDARCVDPFKHRPDVVIDLNLARQAIVDNLNSLCPALKEDHPPSWARNKHEGWKCGWKGSNLPGDTHTIYRLIQ